MKKFEYSQESSDRCSCNFVNATLQEGPNTNVFNWCMISYPEKFSTILLKKSSNNFAH